MIPCLSLRQTAPAFVHRDRIERDVAAGGHELLPLTRKQEPQELRRQTAEPIPVPLLLLGRRHGWWKWA